MQQALYGFPFLLSAADAAFFFFYPSAPSAVFRSKVQWWCHFAFPPSTFAFPCSSLYPKAVSQHLDSESNYSSSSVPFFPPSTPPPLPVAWYHCHISIRSIPLFFATECVSEPCGICLTAVKMGPKWRAYCNVVICIITQCFLLFLQYLWGHKPWTPFTFTVALLVDLQ